MIEGAVIFAAGLLVGVILRSLPPRRHTREARPECQCEHPRALHDPKTHACHQKIYRGGFAGWVRCECRQYVGPEPLPTVFAAGLELPREAQ